MWAVCLAHLDEIGAPEAEYARGTPRVHQLISEVRDDFRITIPLPRVHGRDYAYAIDRARFDDALWRTAARCPTVTALQPFVVTGLIRENDRVIGIRGRSPGGTESSWTASCVVGADGRFSLVARDVQARSYDERRDLPTSLYYAYWRNVTPHSDGGPSIVTCGYGTGYGFLVMDSADGTTCVCVGGQSALLDPRTEKASALYHRLVRSHPRLARRLVRAEQITEVHGMRNVGNLYREAGGPGWALVGDALHQKDPLDGQGIYDAVFTARALSQQLLACFRGEKRWEAAIMDYERAVREETYPMYRVTMERVKRELYTQQPDWAYRTSIRWLATDPEYTRRVGLLLSRAISPAHWLPRTVVFQAMLRGAGQDLRGLLLGQPRTALV